MVKCPCCGKLNQDADRFCGGCGKEISLSQPVEPVAPMVLQEESIVQAEGQIADDSSKVQRNRRIAIVVIIVTAIAVLIAIAVGFQTSGAKKSQRYGENLSSAVNIMLSDAADAESCGNLIKKVWYNAIWKKRDSETDPYTRPRGYFVDDFNDALSNLFSDLDFRAKITLIKENQTLVQSLMKTLQDPPEEYREAYNALSDFYDAYIELTNLVISPSGSLQTFSSSFGKADKEVGNYYKKVSLYVGE